MSSMADFRELTVKLRYGGWRAESSTGLFVPAAGKNQVTLFVHMVMETIAPSEQRRISRLLSKQIRLQLGILWLPGPGRIYPHLAISSQQMGIWTIRGATAVKRALTMLNLEIPSYSSVQEALDQDLAQILLMLSK